MPACINCIAAFFGRCPFEKKCLRCGSQDFPPKHFHSKNNSGVDRGFFENSMDIEKCN